MIYRLRILYPMPIRDDLETAIKTIAENNGGRSPGAGTDGLTRDQDWDFDSPGEAFAVARGLIGVKDLEVLIKTLNNADT